jgi:hypothetical protein
MSDGQDTEPKSVPAGGLTSSTEGSSLLRLLVHGTGAPLAPLMLLAGIPVLFATGAMIATPVMLSRVMTQDLLFNLSGAWHIYQGQIAHVDFHEPIGRLSFVLTAIGMRLSGVGPAAFLFGMVVVTATLFAASAVVAIRRLPPLPAALFILFVSLLALVPANIGDRPEQYTFAMSYNRYCWGAFSIVVLILFVPPGVPAKLIGPDLVVAAGLLLMMFYLKITYFAAGLGSVAVALLICPHIQRQRRAWLALCALLLLNVLAPYNEAYLSEILSWSGSGAIRKSFWFHVNNLMAALDLYSPYLAAIALALGLCGGRLSRFPLTLIFLLGASLLLLTQNSQTRTLPTGVVVFLVVYEELRARFGELHLRHSVPLLLAVLVLPLCSVAVLAWSIVGYHANAVAGTDLFAIDRTNLRGLAVPVGARGAFLSFSPNFDYPGRDSAPGAQAFYQLTDYEYVQVLLEAADILSGRAAGGIALFDSVNPLPFMLGWQPVGGANLWSTWNAPIRPANEYLGPVQYVLIPKFSLNPQWTRDLVAFYGDHLRENFQQDSETSSWILFVRRSEREPAAGRGVEPRPYSPLMGLGSG